MYTQASSHDFWLTSVIQYHIVFTDKDNLHSTAAKVWVPSIVALTNHSWFCAVLSALCIHFLWWFGGPWLPAVTWSCNASRPLYSWLVRVFTVSSLQWCMCMDAVWTHRSFQLFYLRTTSYETWCRGTCNIRSDNALGLKLLIRLQFM